MPTKRRRRTLASWITPDVVQNYQRLQELRPAVERCRSEPAKAEAKAHRKADYSEYHAKLPSCGKDCACEERRQAGAFVNLSLKIAPWENRTTPRVAALFEGLQGKSRGKLLHPKSAIL